MHPWSGPMETCRYHSFSNVQNTIYVFILKQTGAGDAGRKQRGIPSQDPEKHRWSVFYSCVHTRSATDALAACKPGRQRRDGQQQPLMMPPPMPPQEVVLAPLDSVARRFWAAAGVVWPGQLPFRSVPSLLPSLSATSCPGCCARL